MNHFFRICFGNPFKKTPTNIFFDFLGFGISLFGATKLAIIKSWWNADYNCRSFKIVWSTKYKPSKTYQ